MDEGIAGEPLRRHHHHALAAGAVLTTLTTLVAVRLKRSGSGDHDTTVLLVMQFAAATQWLAYAGIYAASLRAGWGPILVLIPVLYVGVRLGRRRVLPHAQRAAQEHD